MVEATEPRHRYDFAGHICNRRWHPTLRHSLVQREVCPVIVVVTHVLSHHSLEMPFVEHDHMIEQVSPAIVDEALSDPILPRTAEAGSLGFDPEALDSA